MKGFGKELGKEVSVPMDSIGALRQEWGEPSAFPRCEYTEALARHWLCQSCNSEHLRPCMNDPI